MQHLDRWWKKFENAKAVVLVGGGSVAIGMGVFLLRAIRIACLEFITDCTVVHLRPSEYAGELKDFYPSTKVTIVHSGPMLLNDTYPDKFRLRAERAVRARGVDVICEDRVDDLTPPSEGKIMTRKGKVVECDLIVCLFFPSFRWSWSRRCP